MYTKIKIEGDNMPIYKELDNCIIMGFYPGELDKKSDKKDFRKEKINKRVTRLK